MAAELRVFQNLVETKDEIRLGRVPAAVSKRHGVGRDDIHVVPTRFRGEIGPRNAAEVISSLQSC